MKASRGVAPFAEDVTLLPRKLSETRLRLGRRHVKFKGLQAFPFPTSALYEISHHPQQYLRPGDADV
jgi:hypothetical protein